LLIVRQPECENFLASKSRNILQLGCHRNLASIPSVLWRPGFCCVKRLSTTGFPKIGSNRPKSESRRTSRPVTFVPPASLPIHTREPLACTLYPAPCTLL
jgi:hypothetical protein